MSHTIRVHQAYCQECGQTTGYHTSTDESDAQIPAELIDRWRETRDALSEIEDQIQDVIDRHQSWYEKEFKTRKLTAARDDAQAKLDAHLNRTRDDR